MIRLIVAIVAMIVAVPLVVERRAVNKSLQCLK